MENMQLGFLIYSIGVVIAMFLVLYDAYKAYKNKESLEEFPGVFPVMSLISWITVIIYIYRYFRK